DDVAIFDQPLAAGQIGQLAAQTRTPPDLAAQNAIYFAGDGRLSANDELRHSSLPLGPTTYYFRTKFQVADDPATAELRLDVAVDDGVVLYLNGSELYRQNMGQGAVSYGTFAASPVGNATLLNNIAVPAGALVRGTNVLTAEVHQAGP